MVERSQIGLCCPLPTDPSLSDYLHNLVNLLAIPELSEPTHRNSSLTKA